MAPFFQGALARIPGVDLMVVFLAWAQDSASS